MAALKESGLKATADFIHPAELERFKNMILPAFKVESGDKQQQSLEIVFGKGMTAEQVEAMSPHAFMSRLMSTVGERIEGLQFDSVEVLGAIPEGNQVHVVARITISGHNDVRLRQLEVITALPHENGWKLALSGQLEGLAEALKAR